ncbi:alpha/beta hydrolase-fold protein [uncultured Draconibacterium sp.]|uniref:alpha/beta hydrolase n=1 Tax=uncultured Draconibacterium sp. TaxID=1573823 RepID=UPI0025FAEF34|nr:alpha/beta hydrolase-fold protein [uncultured Draconibacterium sp.]
MKNLIKLFPLVLLILVGSRLAAQMPGAGRVEYLTMPSEILNEDREYSIFLPAGYEQNTDKSYPILYLLHGGGGSHKDWPTQGNLAAVANQLIASDEAVEMIIVCPEAGKTFMNYFNNPDWRYEDYFFEEMIPYIESNYRVIADKKHRAIAGLSMGGQGTVVYASHHPELFCAAYAMSAYLYAMDLPFINPDDETMQKLQKLVDNNNCINYLANASEEKVNEMKSLKWFIDCGDDDFTFPLNMEYVAEMQKRQIPYQLRVRDGGHTWEYWHSALYIALPFISNCYRDN